METKYSMITDTIYGYQRVDPIPKQEEVERFYLEEFYTTKYKSFNDSSMEVQQKNREFYQAHWKNVLIECEKIIGDLKGKTIFDIGFGFAQALQFFRSQGLIGSGIEPSKEGFEYAKKEGFDVYCSGIEEFSCVGDRRFEIVTLFNVLEHLRNPKETLHNIKTNLIKSGGVLVVDVPNEFNDFQTVANAKYRLNEWWVCPPNHINYFNASSIKKLISGTGYEVFNQEASFPLEMFMLMGDVYVGNVEIGKRCHEKRVLFESTLREYGKTNELKSFYKTMADLNLGRQVITWAKAPIIREKGR